MVKEDRSDWVAVAPEFASASGNAIRPAASAYMIFQKDITDTVRDELKSSGAPFDVGQFSRAVRDRWTALDSSRKSHYEELARVDAARFARESHEADVAAIERQRQRQEAHSQLVLDDEFGDNRKTRRAWKKEMKKKTKKEKRGEKKLRPKKSESEWDSAYEDESEGSSSYDSDETSDSDGSEGKKKKKAVAPRKVSEAALQRREKAKEEKGQKEQYIAQRQDDLRKDRAEQAMRRLDFLLKQSNIFSHFGQVKEDDAKYQTKVVSGRRREDGSTRRSSLDTGGDEAEGVDAQDLDTDEKQSMTYLTHQPSTLGHGKMRQYQLEGLNWMIKLQENGVNGILADEVNTHSFRIFVDLVAFSDNRACTSRWA